MKKVSIIVPVYNVESYVGACLRSIAAQTYGNIECILVDDKGTDSAMEIVENFLENYKGSIDFKIVRCEKNGGLSAARNSGMDASRGDYYYFLDSDDEIIPECISLLAGAMDKFDVDMVGATLAKVYENGDVIYSKSRSKASTPIFQPEIFDLYCDGKLIVNACNKLIRKSAFKDGILRFENGVIYEDRLWSFEVYGIIKSYLFLDEPTYLYKQRENSITHKQIIANAESHEKIMMRISDIIKARNLPHLPSLVHFFLKGMENLPAYYLNFDFAKAFNTYKKHLSRRLPDFSAEEMRTLPSSMRVRLIHRKLPLYAGFAFWCLCERLKRFCLFLKKYLRR